MGGFSDAFPEPLTLKTPEQFARYNGERLPRFESGDLVGEFRPAYAEDVASILASRGLKTDYSGESPTGYISWQDKKGRDVGFVVLREKDPNGEDCLFVEWLWVEPEFRARGAAELMMQYVSDEFPWATTRFTGRNWRAAELAADGPRKNMNGYARALGFQNTRYHNYERPALVDRFEAIKMADNPDGSTAVRVKYVGPTISKMEKGVQAATAVLKPGTVIDSVIEETFAHQGLQNFFKELANTLKAE